MYTEIGAFDAKAQLSRLLNEVKQGHCYTITLRGKPIADLVPSERAVCRDVSESIEAMRSINKVVGVSDEDLADWIAEGRL